MRSAAFGGNGGGGGAQGLGSFEAMVQQYEGMGLGGAGGTVETVQAKLAAKLVLETDALLYGDGATPQSSALEGEGEGEGGASGGLSDGKAGKEVARILKEGDKDDPDLYRVLGLSRRASFAAVKEAFRRLVLLVHPDKIRGDLRAPAGEAFQLVQEAYEVLASPGERQKYDAYLKKMQRKRWRQRVRPVIDKLDEWADVVEPFWRRRRRIALGLFLMWALVL